MKLNGKHFASRILSSPTYVLAILGVAFFFAYSWLYLVSPAIYNSPDETAAFVFASEFVQESDFHLEFFPNPNNLIHPRSVNIIGSVFVPGGFIGHLALLGMVGKINPILMQVLPAAMAVLAVFAFYGIIRRMFSQRVALLCAILLFFAPQWWHYVAKGFLPNVLFVSFLLLSIYAFLRSQEGNHPPCGRAIWAIGSGFALGMALGIRPNELWWIVIPALALLWMHRSGIAWRLVFFTILASLIPLILLTSLQIQTFGSILNTGYTQYQAVQDQGRSMLLLSQLFFPFGIDFVSSIVHFFQFFLILFWWQSIFLVTGVVMWAKRKEKSRQERMYLAVFLFVLVYLVLYYGAWEIADDLDVSRISIGISYVRYWLPAFIAALPFVVLGIDYWAKRISKTSPNVVFLILFTAIVLGQAVFVYEGKDGIYGIRQTVLNYEKIRNEIVEKTESNAVIIGERDDKILWPTRQVIHFQNQDFGFVAHLDQTVEQYPVYWMTLLPNDHVRIWEERVFAANGLKLEYRSEIGEDRRLYQVLHK